MNNYLYTTIVHDASSMVKFQKSIQGTFSFPAPFSDESKKMQVKADIQNALRDNGKTTRM